MQELSEEQHRVRDRLHKLEGLVGMLVDEQRYRQNESAKRQEQIKFRLSLLTATVAIAAVIVPVITAILVTR